MSRKEKDFTDKPFDEMTDEDFFSDMDEAMEVILEDSFNLMPERELIAWRNELMNPESEEYGMYSDDFIADLNAYIKEHYNA